MQARAAADEDKIERRYLRLKDEMLALGWEEQYFPRWSDEEDFFAWEKYMNQPKEFSARGKFSAMHTRKKFSYTHRMESHPSQTCRDIQSHQEMPSGRISSSADCTTVQHIPRGSARCRAETAAYVGRPPHA